MRDSTWAVPFYNDFLIEEEQQAIKKQKCYDSELECNGTLLNKVKDMNTAEAFQFLKGCNCCFTHQFNKPIALIELNNDTVIKPFSFHKKQKNCKCDCRQLSRMLCRGWDLNTLP